jgi:hypothetical protein
MSQYIITSADALLRDVSSENIETQLTAIEASVDLMRQVAKTAVGELGNKQSDYLVAERLHGFGSVVIKPLEEFIAKSSSLDERTLAAWVLLKVGSSAGLPHLLEAIEKSRNYHCLAAEVLARARFNDAAGRIIARLRRADITDELQLISLLSSLKKLNAELPPDLERKFLAEDVNWMVRSTVQKEWPNPMPPAARESHSGRLRV